MPPSRLGLSNQDDEYGDEYLPQGVQFVISVDSNDLYTTFNSKLDPKLYTVKAQFDNEGKATSFEVFRTGPGQPQKVFSTDDTTKTCSFSQPFDPAIIDTYANKAASQIPEKILQISSCESLETLKDFLEKYEQSNPSNPIQFHVPTEVREKIIQKVFESLQSPCSEYQKAQHAMEHERQARTEVTDFLEKSKLIAKPEAVANLLNKRNRI